MPSAGPERHSGSSWKRFRDLEPVHGRYSSRTRYSSMLTVPARERYCIARINCLRAAVLSANDGILSTASLLLGVAPFHASYNNVVGADLAGRVARAMSTAAGDYSLATERAEQKADDSGEHAKLAAIYVSRGLQARGGETGRPAAHRPRRIGRTCPRRTRHFRNLYLSRAPVQAALASAPAFAGFLGRSRGIAAAGRVVWIAA
jgi:hypothetical protein